MSPEAKLREAELQVVQHGSRSSFRRRVVDALRSVVTSTSAFCFLGRGDGRAVSDATRVVGDNRVGINLDADVRLAQAFTFTPADVCATTRRAYLLSELYPADEWQKVPYFAGNGKEEAIAQVLLVFLHEGGVLFGVCGLERTASEGVFTQADVATLDALASFIMAGARTQLAYDELAREASCLRALGGVSGALYFIDRDAKQVIWAADRERGIDWEEDVVKVEDTLVNAAERLLASRARGEALPTPPRMANGSVTAVSKIDDDPVFSQARVCVVRVEPLGEQNTAMDTLSRREREIARLLVAGYSGVNVAAIAGLSENTVRTYVRRLYLKLGVSNRADLVRKLMAPEPKLGTGPTSHIAPPDSSLATGDDTLD
ncbi:MAG: helix-turn-helix transcriptional regulator [Polyangiaceae bacterium]